MERLLEILQFRTAIPFGYALFFLLLCLMASVGLLVFIVGLLRRHTQSGRLVACAGWLMLCGAIIVYAANWLFEARLDLNPSVQPKELAGEWNDGKARLHLRDNGTFELEASGKLARRLGAQRAAGQWSLDDYNLHLQTPAGHPHAALRVIRFGQHYRIIIDDFGDFDAWDGRLGFKQSKKET
jgi:hypothetical protein